jgi:hypothetical protein
VLESNWRRRFLEALGVNQGGDGWSQVGGGTLWSSSWGETTRSRVKAGVGASDAGIFGKRSNRAAF